MLNIAAYTSPGTLYPAFISMNMPDDLSYVEVSVRSEGSQYPSVIRMSLDAFGAFTAQMTSSADRIENAHRTV